jgi:hypothetical protein
MKKLLIVFIALMIPLTALAQTAETPAPGPAQTVVGEAYLRSCDARRDARMSAASQTEMCTCAATQMGQSMSAEDIKALGQNDQAGRMAQNTMLLDVYVPCMNFPIQSVAEAQCLQDPDTAKITKTTPQQMCHCAGRKAGYWFVAGGRDLMTQLLIANPNIADPVGPVIDSPAFKQALHDGMMSCATAGP